MTERKALVVEAVRTAAHMLCARWCKKAILIYQEVVKHIEPFLNHPDQKRMPENMYFEFNNVSYAYGETKALRSLSFSASKGQIVGLIGENGAGKSTAIKNIVRFIKPDKGIILLDGMDIQTIKIETYPVSYIPDVPVFYEELSLLEHLQFMKSLFPDNNTSVDDLVSLFDMQEHKYKIPSALSMGTRKKLSISMALLRDFDMLIADEPFTGLDPSQISVLKRALLNLKNSGKLILLSSHLLDVVESICDRYVILKKGSLLADGTKKELLLREGFPETASMETLYLRLAKQYE